MNKQPTIPALEDPRARCMACGYFLVALASPGRCPECGRAFDLADRATFLEHEPFARWRYWLPGLSAATIVMVVGMLYGVFVMGAWGWSIWLATPLAAGVLAGYGMPIRRSLTALFPLLVLGCAFIIPILLLSLGGAFCALLLAVILLVPLASGLFLGWALRGLLKHSSFSQRWFLPLIVLGLVGAYWLDGPRRPSGVERIVTEARVAVSADEAFDALLFYEEVRHAPPWLLRIGLVRPLGAAGSCKKPGDVKVCVYNRGRITKRLVAVAPGRRLDFEVIEQQIGYEHDVALLGGSFEFEPLGDSQCLVRLTTEYRPLLTPRFCWRWGERIAVHTLHRHVIEGIAREAERCRAVASEELAALGGPRP